MWYYNLSPQRSVTVRYVLCMNDTVDGEALKRAVQLTVSRYPYLCKRIVKHKESYYLQHNPLPVVVLNTIKPITLCGTEANYHQFAISYSDRSIFFNNTHSIYDGRGRGPFLHTLVYYYCKFRYDEVVDMPGVWLADSPIRPEEWYDPFDFALPEPEIKLPKLDIPAGAMKLADMGYVHRSVFQVHYLCINEKDVMQICKEKDATPNTFISLLMARAIARIHPDSKDPIVAGVYCDVRNPLGAELSHHPLVTTLSLEYKPEMRNLPIDIQDTIFRGMIILQSDPSYLLEGQKGIAAVNEVINSQPTLEGKIAVAQGALGQVFRQHTFLVSYSGRGTFGSCDKHITAAFPMAVGMGMGLLMEITSAAGYFYITFIQEWKEDIYFDAFLKEIIGQGLDFNLLLSAQNEQAKFSLK